MIHTLLLQPLQLLDFHTLITDFYHVHGRLFPWRKTNDPYAILVSEVMLQQTQTERVVAKYKEWISLFPDTAALAASPLPCVITAWNGLGYNRRARFLQDACKKIITCHDGIFPSDAATLETLPGIGPYTARAVSVFAFNKPEVFIETNIRSVFIYTFFRDTTEPVSDKQLLPFIEQTLDRINPREWYYALMDYGAMLKKEYGNPSRKSTLYTKQSKFSGSTRQARGAVLRCLSKQKQMTAAKIAETEQLDMMCVIQAIKQLEKEKFIFCKGDIWRLAE
jgi:A/G-specific adenine glycosylase